VFLSIVLACTNPNVLSCNIYSNVKDIFPTREECLVDATRVRDNFLNSGIYAKAGCIELEDKGIDT
jgi:hypothetical protein|tara:strand:+ start:301 stop:498 length:198 start_codon:yes stop_codon:yes gene_type:complete